MDLDPGLLICAAALGHDRVIDRLEIAKSIQAGDQRIDLGPVERLRDQGPHSRDDGLLIRQALVVHPDEVHHGRGRNGRRAPLGILLVGGWIKLQRRQLLRQFARGEFALQDRASHLEKVGR